MRLDLGDIEAGVRSAVARFWRTRLEQTQKQAQGGSADQGARSAVTGGKQMDGFVEVLCGIVRSAGIPDAAIFCEQSIELPGFFRATKKWDMLVVANEKLLAAMELKSQVGPSFGNNFNNRTEEAIGSAVDLWTAYREGAFRGSPRPWLGYFFLLEDDPGSRTPVGLKEPHFAAFPEFQGSSYMKRYELLCRKLVLEGHYESAAFLTSPVTSGVRGGYEEPAPELAFRQFAASLAGKMAAFAAMRG